MNFTQHLIEYRNAIALISNAIFLFKTHPEYTLETKMKLLKQIDGSLIDLKRSTIFLHNTYAEQEGKPNGTQV